MMTWYEAAAAVVVVILAVGMIWWREREVRKRMFRCTAFIGEMAIVTTNDVSEYDRLTASGGTMLCHPELFNQLGGESDSSQSELIPYSVQIQRDILAQLRPVPTGIPESYETQLYDSSQQ